MSPQFGPAAEDCTNSVYVTVDLLQDYPITGVTVWHYYADGRQYCNQKIALSTTGAFAGEEDVVYETGPEYGPPETAEGISQTFPPTEARYVRHWSGRSTANGGVNFLEMDVYGGGSTPVHHAQCCPNCHPATAGRDLSTGRPASSSSIWSAETPPSKANDGNLGRSHPNEFHSSSSAAEGEPWWSVQLSERTTSPTITFYARDCCTDNMQHRVQFFLTDSWDPASLDSMTPCLVFTDVQDGSTTSGICEGSGEYLVAATQTETIQIPEIVVTSSGSC